MTLYRIVEHLDKVKYLRLCLVSSSVDLLFRNALLEGCKKALSDRVVVTISAATHRRLKVILFEESKVIGVALLTSLITMGQYPLFGLPLPYRDHQCSYHQISVDVLVHRPTYCPARKQIQNRGDIEKSFVGSHVRDIADPCLIRFAGIKITLENIIGDAACFSALHVSTFIPYLGFEPVLAHDSSNAVDAAGLARVSHVSMNPRASVSSTTGDEERLYLL